MWRKKNISSRARSAIHLQRKRTCRGRRKKFHLSRRTSGGLTFLLRFPPKADDEKVPGFVPSPLKVVHLRSPKLQESFLSLISLITS